MTKFIGADSLAFVTIDGMYRAMGVPGGRDDQNPGFCDACFTGDYPIPLVDFTDGTSDDRVSVLAE